MTPAQTAQPAAATSGGACRRAHVRYLCRRGLELRLAIRPTYRGHRALIHDLSAGGVGLLLAVPLDVGTAVAVEVGGESAVACSRLARVAHVRPHPAPPRAPWLPRPHPLLALVRRLLRGPEPPGDCWFVGCQFEQPLGEDEVWRLLRGVRAAGPGALSVGAGCISSTPGPGRGGSCG